MRKFEQRSLLVDFLKFFRKSYLDLNEMSDSDINCIIKEYMDQEEDAGDQLENYIGKKGSIDHVLNSADEAHEYFKNHQL